MTRILVSSGCGFIGPAVIRRAVAIGYDVVNVDFRTYAANETNSLCVEGLPKDQLSRVESQGLQVGSPEEVAWQQGFLSGTKLQEQTNRFLKIGYGRYLLQRLEKSK